MKKISLFLMLIVSGFLALSAQTDQLQSKPLTGYIQLGEVDVNGWFTVEYVGNENVNLSATVNGSSASIINGRIKLPSYGTYVVVVTAKAQGYATLTVTFDDVVWEPDEHNYGNWIVLIDGCTEEKIWYQFLGNDDYLSFNSFDIYMTHDGDHLRYFYYVIDGVNYGAPDDDSSLYLNDWLLNPLIASSGEVNYYYVDAGYAYILGLKRTYDELTGDLTGYCAYGYRLYTLPSGVFGDVNGDYYVNISDVTALIDHLLSGSSIIRRNADVNYDGAVNIGDVTALIDMLLH